MNNLKVLVASAFACVFMGCSQGVTDGKTQMIKSLIEKQIAFELPPIEILYSETGKASFTGDKTNSTYLKFTKEADLEPLFNEIKKRIDNPAKLTYESVNGQMTIQDSWSVSKEGIYRYSFWSQGTNDIVFELEINPNDSTVLYKQGSW